MPKWHAVIPHGRFMGGQVLPFRTKKRTEEFLKRWNETARKLGETELRFYRSGPFRFEAIQAGTEQSETANGI